MKPLINKKYILPGLLLLSVLAGGCDARSDRLRQGEEHLRRGRYFQALQVYRALYREHPQDPRVLAGLGRIYSVRRLTAFAGRDLLQASLKQKKDPGNLDELLWLLVSMGRFEEALSYLQEPWIRLEQLFSPKTETQRLGLLCLQSPSSRRLNRLLELSESSTRDRYVFLCSRLFVQSQRKPQAKLKEKKEKIDKSYERLKTRKRRFWCESLSLADSLRILKPEERSEREQCKKEFHGNIIIQREAMHVEFQASTPPWLFSSRGLFFVNPYEVEDPGRPDLPQWPGPREIFE